MLKLLVPLSLCLIFGYHAGYAQRRPDGLSIGATFRTVNSVGERTEGVLLRLSADSLGFVNGTRQFVVTLPQLDSIWRRENQSGHGAAAGLIAGVVFGGFAGAYLVRANCDNGNSCGGDYVEAVPLGALFFGAIGTGFGAVVGSLSHRWRLIYAAAR